MLRFYYIVFFMLCNTVIFSLNITISEFAVADVNIDNTGGVITPTGPGAILTNESLTAALSIGNVTINTNGAGDIDFNFGVSYTANTERTLTLMADGDILNLNNSIGASSPVNYIIQATGNFTIAFLGLNTFGGNMDIETDGMTTIQDNGLVTGGGNVDIETDGILTIVFLGLKTFGGNVDIKTNESLIIMNGSSIDTGGGNVDIETGGICTIEGLTTDGGNVDIKTGGMLTIAGVGINVGAANHLNLMANGAITISSGFGVQATNPNLSLLIDATTSHDIVFFVTIAGGEVELIGNNIETTGTALSSSGPTEVNIYAAGDFTSTGNGVSIAGGSIAICAGNDILVQHAGVSSGGGSIALQAEGTITLNDDSANSSPGTGGVLTVTEGSPGSIVQNAAPTVGAGDILLNTNYVFSLPAPPVPTMGQWGLIILGLLLMTFGVLAIIDSKVSTLNYR